MTRRGLAALSDVVGRVLIRASGRCSGGGGCLVRFRAQGVECAKACGTAAA